ncbi:class I glutamine amidotransferase-like protein [Cercophora newfieldiana]|uniref:Class I glutamine amidotransferase-like protein n=1 Tax=Cercophora newfieldiana TaxID=92897 RepID=A0AA39XXC4_9PEZI|nr:class I glutamine amidotransferase-like protein [Cercophora newfieldiana]
MRSPPPPPPLRLAVLEADTPLPGVDARYNGYHGVFKDLFVRAVDPAPIDSVLTLSKHDVVKDLTSYPDLESIDAILITGSKHSAFENDEWITTLVDFTRKAIAHPRVRIVGVCFGHQIVSRALGVPVQRAEAGWEVSVTETQLTPAGQDLFGGRKTLKIQQMHRDQALGVPPGATLLASSAICPNHGFLTPGNLITVQGHPEFTSDIMREILESRRAIGLFTDDVYESGMERRSEAHDGVFMARAFLKFLQEPTQLAEPQ